MKTYLSKNRTIAVGVGIFILGAFAGNTLFSKTIETQKKAVVSAQNTNMGSDTIDLSKEHLDLFWEVWSKLEFKYPFNDEEPTDEERIHAAIAGMVDSFGDPYTTFLPPEESDRFTTEFEGSFGGVGMEVGEDDSGVHVIAPLKDSPAQKAGILAGDIILAVDEEDVTDLGVIEVVNRIRGPQGEPVTISILRKETREELDITITRDTIDFPVISGEIEKYDDSYVGYIEISTFNNKTSDLLKDEIERMIEDSRHLSGLVLDLRSNPGGILQEAIDVASFFLPAGAAVVRDTSGTIGVDAERVYRSFGFDIFPDKYEDLPVAILIDGGTASASEILAGALQEHNKAILVGKKSYGKGSVQELLPISDGSSLKVTVSRWYTPNGTSISREGLTPDYPVSYGTPEEIQEGKDKQKEAAFKRLLGEDITDMLEVVEEAE